MPYVFLLLLIAAIVALIVGLIKPSLVLGKNGRRLGVLVIYSLAALGSVVGIAVTAPRPEAGNTAAPSQAQIEAAPAKAVPVAAAPKPFIAHPLPEGQKRFVEAVEAARQQYRAAQADIQKGAARAARKTAICSAFKGDVSDGSPVHNWIGRVKALTVNSEGKGVLAISVAPDVILKTWNNAISDIGDRTLIEPNTPVYTALLTMKEGDEVVFSASVRRSDVDCIHEMSMSLSGSMLNPEFLMRVREIRPAG